MSYSPDHGQETQREVSERGYGVELLERIFEAALHPEQFDELEKAWEQFLDDTFQTPLSSEHEARLSKNISYALELINRLDKLTELQVDANQLVSLNPGFAVIIDQNYDILARNEAFDDAFPHIGARLLDSDFRAFTDWIAGRRNAQNSSFCFSMVATDVGLSKTVMAVPVYLRSAPNEEVFILTELDILLDDGIAGELESVFGLTGAEAQIGMLLSNGLTPHEIAAQRGVSINTVRAQIKIVIEKVGVRSTTDLVRTLCGLAARLRYLSASTQASVLEAPHHYAEERQLKLPDGRVMNYFLQGAKNGRPAVFLHSLFEGPVLFEKANALASQAGICIIAPSRPGFGKSDPAPRLDLDASLSRFGFDLLALLDALDIERCPIIGQHHALRFAAEHPDRASVLIHHNGVPIWRDEMLTELTRRRRNLIKTSMLLPGTLRLLVKIGAALVDSGQEVKLLKGIAHGAPSNLSNLASSDFLQHARWECRHNAAQGSESFLHETPLLHMDTDAHIAVLKCPVWLNRYLDQSHVPPSAASAYRKLVPRAVEQSAKDFEALWTNLFGAVIASFD